MQMSEITKILRIAVTIFSVNSFKNVTKFDSYALLASSRIYLTVAITIGTLRPCQTPSVFEPVQDESDSSAYGKHQSRKRNYSYVFGRFDQSLVMFASTMI
jgi:hypothetical protein